MKTKIKSWWFTGFVQCDGSFGVAHSYSETRSIPFYPIPTFSITQSVRERALMLDIFEFLGVGT